MKRFLPLFLLLILVFLLCSCDFDTGSGSGTNTPGPHTCQAGNWTVSQEATCTTAGMQIRKCSICQQEMENEEIPATGHISSEWIVITASSCTNEGLQKKECTSCKKELEKEIIPMHKIVTHEAVKATCLATGLTKGSECSACGEVFEEQKVVPMTEHTWETTPAIKATCVNTGKTQGVSCSFCLLVKVEPEIVEKVPHNPTTINAIAPTCTKSGNTEGSKCSGCGEIYVRAETLPALGHSFDETTGECAQCHDSDYVKYTIWDTFLNEYTSNRNFILDLREMEFNSSKDYTITIKSTHDYIRVIGDADTVYTNLFFVIENRYSKLDMDFVNVNIQNKSEVSTQPIITSTSACEINLGLYGKSFKMAGRKGDGGEDNGLGTPTNGKEGNIALDLGAAKLNILCSTKSATISGGNGGNGGNNPNKVADGANGAIAIHAGSITVKFADGYSQENISITGGKGGSGGHTWVWFKDIYGEDGDDAQASNVEIKYS